MGGIAKTAGNVVGTIAKTAAPIVNKIPGVGSAIAPLLAAGGNVLQGHNLQSTLMAGLGAMNPLSFGNLAGQAAGLLGGGQTLQDTFSKYGGQLATVMNQQNPAMFGAPSNLPGLNLPGGGYTFPLGGFNPQMFNGSSGGTPLFPGQVSSPSQQQSQQGIDWGNMLKMLGIGAGATGLAAIGANNGIFDPRVVSDPRNKTTDQFSAMLAGALNGGRGIGDILSGASQLPGYEGLLTQGMSPDQIAAIGAGNQGLQQFMSGDQGAGALSTLANFAQSGNQLQLPPEIAALLGNQQSSQVLSGIAQGDSAFKRLADVFSAPNQDAATARSLVGPQANSGADRLMQLSGFQAQDAGTLRQLASGYNNPYLSALAQSGFGDNPAVQALFGLGANNQLDPTVASVLNFQANSPERQLLLQAGSQDPTAAAQGGLIQIQQMLQGLSGSDAVQQLLAGGGVPDLQAITEALDNSRRFGLNRDVRDLREQFSFNGLRNSTDLNQAVATRQSESEANMMAQLAQIAPTLFGQQQQGKLGALGAISQLLGQAGQLGNQAGQLGLGAQQNVLNAFGQAGQLGQQSAGTNLQALLGGGQLQQGGLAQQLQALLGGGQLQQGQQQILQSGLNAASGQNITQLQALASAFSNAGQLDLGAQQSNVAAAQGAGNLQAQEAQRQSQLAQAMAQIEAQNRATIAQQQIAAQQAQLQAASQLGGQNNQAASIMAQLFGGQQGNALQAALAQPGALSQLSQLPGLLAQGNFNLNEAGRAVNDTDLQRQYAEFVRQQSLAPQLLSFLSATPQQQVGNSLASQLGALGLGAYGLFKG